MDEIKKTIKMMKKGLINPDNKLSLIPNWLSFSRSIGGVLIPLLIYSGAPAAILAGTISFIALSDFFDGKVARLLVGEETEEGALLDAVSDKIFAFLLMFFIIPVMPIFLVNVLLEAGVSSINGKLLSKGGKPKSNLIGKIKTWPLFTGIGLSYIALSLGNLGGIAQILMNTSTVLSILTAALECINIKQYYDNYKEAIIKDNIEVDFEEDKKIEDAEPKKSNSYKLCRENNPVIVFENDNNIETPEDVKEVNPGKQKKMKL